MAAPNIVNVTTITAKTALVAMTTSLSSLLTNPSNSGAVLKINSITYANYTTAPVTGTATVLRSGTTYYLVGNVSVPANSTLIVTGKDTAFYLEEGDAIQGNASSNSAMSAVIAYEIIS